MRYVQILLSCAYLILSWLVVEIIKENMQAALCYSDLRTVAET